MTYLYKDRLFNLGYIIKLCKQWSKFYFKTNKFNIIFKNLFILNKVTSIKIVVFKELFF